MEADALDRQCQLAFGPETDLQVAHVQHGIRRARIDCPAVGAARHRSAMTFGHGSLGAGRGDGRVQFTLVVRSGHRKVFLGSKASRTPSKMNTRSDSMIAKVKNEVKASQGACRFCFACSAISPSDADPAGRP